jgi:glycosyltransferase involved in cell wall biosynthesis
MVKVTVTLVTKKREPRFKYAFESLKEQTIPHRDFEYIIIDGYYHTRKNEVLSLIEKMKFDFPVLYLPDKPSRWKGQRFQICNARNTALIFANGKWIVNHDDCTKMSKDWIEKHLKLLEMGKDYIVTGSWIGYQFIVNGEGVMGVYGPEDRMKIIKVPQQVNAGWFYGQNCSYPLESVLNINGFDEELDGEMGQEDINLGIRLERNGLKVIYDPTNTTGVYTPTHNYERLIEPILKKLKDGREYPSNIYITQRLQDDIDRVLPYGNFFDIKNIRKMVRQYDIGNDLDRDTIYKNMKVYINPDPYDWRDGRLIEDKLKE